jgi:hypothetical protein
MRCCTIELRFCFLKSESAKSRESPKEGAGGDRLAFLLPDFPTFGLF